MYSPVSDPGCTVYAQGSRLSPPVPGAPSALRLDSSCLLFLQLRPEGTWVLPPAHPVPLALSGPGALAPSPQCSTSTATWRRVLSLGALGSLGFENHCSEDRVCMAETGQKSLAVAVSAPFTAEHRTNGRGGGTRKSTEEAAWAW